MSALTATAAVTCAQQIALICTHTVTIHAPATTTDPFNPTAGATTTALAFFLRKAQRVKREDGSYALAAASVVFPPSVTLTTGYTVEYTGITYKPMTLVELQDQAGEIIGRKVFLE